MRLAVTTRRLALLAFFVLLALAGMTGPASAHAQLEGTDPHAGDVLATAPALVTLAFGEPVESAADAVQVFDDHLHRADLGAASHAAGDTSRIQVRLRGHLHDGTYIVSWHVSSSDTHPVSGTFRFSIGAPSEVTGKVPVTGRNDSAGLVLGILRALGYAGLILAPGALSVLLLLWPAGLLLARTRRTLYAGLGLLTVSAVGSMFLEGVWASGQPWSALWVAPSSLDSHSRRFDTLYALRCYSLVLFGVLLAVTISSRTKAAARAAAPRRRNAPAARSPVAAGVPPWLPAVALGASAVLLMITWPLAGHAAAGTQTPLAITVDLLHLAAMAVWLGGLAVLAVSLPMAAARADLRAVLPRFSRVAFGCVVVLVASGTYQTWRDVGTLPALYRTTFGQVLLVKLAAVIGAIALGGLARLWVRRHLRAAGATSDEDAPVATFRRGLLAELGVGAGVLAMTAALVVLVPGRQAYIRPFDRTLTAAGLQVAVRIDEPRAGDTVLHMTARAQDGNAIPVTSMRGSLWLPAGRIGPLPLRPAGAKGAAADGREDIGLSFPRRGRWVVQFTVETSPLDATVFSLTVPVT
jgi:copper transport protein